MVRRVIYFVRRVKAYLIEGCGAQGKIKLYQYMLPNAILIVFHNISKNYSRLAQGPHDFV
jgi:hypothetical protein